MEKMQTNETEFYGTYGGHSQIKTVNVYYYGEVFE